MKALLDALAGLDFEQKVSLHGKIGHLEVNGYNMDEEGESLRIMFARPFEDVISFILTSVTGRTLRIEVNKRSIRYGEFERGSLVQQGDLIERLHSDLLSSLKGELDAQPYEMELLQNGMKSGGVQYFSTEKEASKLIDVLVNNVEEHEFTMEEGLLNIMFDSHRMSEEKLMFRGKLQATLEEESFFIEFITKVSVVGDHKLELATVTNFVIGKQAEALEAEEAVV